MGFSAPSREVTTEKGADMSRKSFLSDPEHWRTRAEGARSVAEEVKELNIKDALLGIADEYDQLAHRVEDWALRHLPKH